MGWLFAQLETFSDPTVSIGKMSKYLKSINASNMHANKQLVNYE